MAIIIIDINTELKLICREAASVSVGKEDTFFPSAFQRAGFLSVWYLNVTFSGARCKWIY